MTEETGGPFLTKKRSDFDSVRLGSAFGLDSPGLTQRASCAFARGSGAGRVSHALPSLNRSKGVVPRMDASAYRQPGEIPPPDDKLDHAMLDRVLLAVNATFRSAEFSPLSHYQDHVQYRWATNLRRALNGCDEFIWADQSWGFRYDMMRMPWWKFLWKTRKMPLADRLMWASDRLRRRQEIRALPARSGA